jgi:hypothetical protein
MAMAFFISYKTQSYKKYCMFLKLPYFVYLHNLQNKKSKYARGQGALHFFIFG